MPFPPKKPTVICHQQCISTMHLQMQRHAHSCMPTQTDAQRKTTMGDVILLLQLGGLLPVPPPSGSELACGRAARWKSDPPPPHSRTDISIFPPCL